MNIQAGKSVGIALLLAAGLLAALFAMGVFSASGVGAQAGPTATAAVSDMNNDNDAATTAPDTLTISLKGLSGVSSGPTNSIMIAMPDRLGTGAMASWSGGDQFADTFSNITYAGGAYSLSFTSVGSIAPGAATITITLGTGSNIDSNTMITAMTLGRDTGATLNTVTNVPLSISGAPAGPTIKLSPMSVAVGTTTATTVTVTGSHIMGSGDVTISGPATGMGSTIADVTVSAATISATGGFAQTVTIPADQQTTAGTIAITATRTGSLPAMANFTVNNLPTFAAAYGDLFFGSQNDKAQIVKVVATDADDHPLTFKAVSSDTDVATVTAKADATTAAMDANIAVTPVAPGTSTITVTAMDSVGGYKMTTFDVTVLGVVSSTNMADAGVVLKIIGRAEARVRGGRDIVIGLPGYAIPEGGIDEDDVLVTGPGASFYGNPADVSVSGSSVTITIPTKVAGPGGQSIDTEIGVGGYEVRFKKGAGLRNPNSAGTKTVTVTDADPVAHKLPVSIMAHVSVSPAWVSRGDTFTVTGKGINANGDTTAHLYLGTVSPSKLTNLELVESSRSLVLGKSARDGGTASVEGISTSRSEFEANAKNAAGAVGAKGTNLIVMVDAAGVVVGYTYLGLLPSVALDVTDVRRTGEVIVTVSDWYYGDYIDLVRINGITVNLPDNTNKPNDSDSEPDPWVHPTTHANHEVAVDSKGSAKFTVVVDRDTRLGEMQVDLRGKKSYLKQGSADSPDIHKQTVQVGFFPLTLTPATAVTEQVIQIEGEEFLARTCITSITVGERSIDEATNGDRVVDRATDCVDTDSNGKLTSTFLVPRGLTPGVYSVVVRDAGNRVGEAKLEVPKPTITLDPMTSQRGSTVTVVGESFPADDVVTISYRGITVEAAQTDTQGDFRANFQVPITAPIGATHKVLVASEHKADNKLDPPKNHPEVALTASADHRVSDETLAVSPDKVAPGQQLSIVAGNLPLFTPVSVKIGGREVAGKVLGEENASDGLGNYVDSVLVPQLPPGTTLVELTVHTIRGDDVRVAEFVEITNIVTRPTDEVFEDLIAANQLVVVWRYDNATSTWASYDPTAPAELNDLTLVSTNDIVWVEVTENVMFQGGQLYAGWNLITLE